MERAPVEKDVVAGLPDAQAVNHRVGNQTKGLNNQVVCGCAAEQNIGEGLQQKNAGTNQYDQLDAGSDEAAPIEIAPPRSETWRHKRSVRPRMQRRQSAVSMLVVSAKVCDATAKNCQREILENSRLPGQAASPLRVERWVVVEDVRPEQSPAGRLRRVRRKGSRHGAARQSRTGW